MNYDNINGSQSIQFKLDRKYVTNDSVASLLVRLQVTVFGLLYLDTTPYANVHDELEN